MYKLVAIDLDGTLLTDDLIISPNTVTAIQRAVEAGTIVTIATGRMFSSAKLIALQLNLNVPLITYQGALVKDVNEKQVVYERIVPPHIAQKIIEISREKQLHLQLYQDDILYSAVENDKLIAYAEAVKVPYRIEPNLIKLAEKGVTKLLFIEEPHVLDLLQGELQSLIGDFAHIAKSKKHYLEITHPEANKGNALLFLANMLGVERTEIIGIGDNYNDIELIAAAGLGVAMGNAVKEIKDMADYTTFSNNEEGVLHVLEKFVLEPASVLKDEEQKNPDSLTMG
ncbi:Cof-type HAD-IIB family hydrolase [Planococcus sp. N064]|uniref:Cof-type HAD-IIB family hydrolase n=1 Tax=Planococcus liqunii TaxID=3058394 RepID=A0ABT8MLJ5_9BACL|nr:Cof-type HAD-IIB family hydrolase [Planococcus sp. N064]MDN7225756.1 Cof-type HAD-IIB family hydrolase [Planococcus sp. N064]